MISGASITWARMGNKRRDSHMHPGRLLRTRGVRSRRKKKSSLERVGAEVFNYASRELKHHEASIIGLAVLPFRSVGASHGGGQG